MRRIFLFALLWAGLVQPLTAKEKPFAAVEEAVLQRTGRTVQWEQEMAARAESRTQVQALLRRPLTISAAVQVALLNNRGLQAVFEEVGLSQAELRAARQLPNPEASLEVKFPDRAPRNALYEWDIAQNFLALVMLPLRLKVAKQQLSATQMRIADEVTQLVAEVKIACFEFLAAEQLAGRQKAMREAEGASLQLMQELHAAGNVTDLALAREQSQYSEWRLEFAFGEAESRTAREKLNRLLGVWGAETEWRFASAELPAVPEEEISLRSLETAAIVQRLDLAAARSNLEAAVRAAGLEKNFRFFGALDFGMAGEAEPDGTKLTGPSFRFELPLFNHGQSRVARAESQVRIAAAKFEQLAIDLRSEVREWRDRLVSRHEAARFYTQELLPMRRRVTELTLSQYNAMLVSAFEMFTARREDLAAERGLIEVQRDYWIARARLERAVGGTLNPKKR